MPDGTDTLYWASSEIPSEEKASANLVSRAAKSFKDIRTEILALQELIRLSANPVNEFDRLCELQLGEGDLVGYGYSLASRYLITKTAQERETLKSEIRGLLAKVDTPEFCDPHWKWVITMIMYKLEDRSLHGICFNLHHGMPYYRNMDAAFLKQISQKSPELSSWVDQQLAYNNTKQQAQTNYSYTDKGQKGRKVRSQVNQDSHQSQLPPAQPTESGEGASEPMPDLNFQRPQRHERAVNIVAPSKGSQGMEYDMKRLRDRFNRPLNGGIEPQPRRYFKKRQSEGDEVPKRQESQRKKADESHTRQMDEGEDKSPTEDEVKIEFEHGKYSVRIERERHAAKLKREKRIAEIESEKRAAEASQLLERERERGRYAEHERERERERHTIELKNERDSARQTAERERDKYAKELAAIKAAKSAEIDQKVAFIEAKQEAMRTAVRDMLFENEMQAEFIRRREGEQRILQEAAEKEHTLTSKLEERALADATISKKKDEESFRAAQKLIEVAEKIEKEVRERNEQEVKTQANRQELQRLVSFLLD